MTTMLLSMASNVQQRSELQTSRTQVTAIPVEVATTTTMMMMIVEEKFQRQRRRKSTKTVQVIAIDDKLRLKNRPFQRTTMVHREEPQRALKLAFFCMISTHREQAEEEQRLRDEIRAMREGKANEEKREQSVLRSTLFILLNDN
jgi:hypothetical protein